MSTTINYTEMRLHLRDYIDQVNDTHEPITITTHDHKNVVLLSAEDWSAIEETAYLNASPTNRTRLQESLGSHTTKMTLDELDAYVQPGV
jgi:antitoxin YefM